MRKIHSLSLLLVLSLLISLLVSYQHGADILTYAVTIAISAVFCAYAHVQLIHPKSPPGRVVKAFFIFSALALPLSYFSIVRDPSAEAIVRIEGVSFDAEPVTLAWIFSIALILIFWWVASNQKKTSELEDLQSRGPFTGGGSEFDW